jgi:serine/threonine protein kinase
MAETLQADSSISHYRIVSKIGAGGMGEVYLAEDTKLETAALRPMFSTYTSS